MTKLSNLSSKANQPAIPGRLRRSQALPNESKWNPNKPTHATQDEFWEHIHEIERGPFISVEECFNNIRGWMREQGRNL